MTLKEELIEAVRNAGLDENDVFIEGSEKEIIISKIKQNFIIGNPRALWLGFNKKPDILPLENDDEENILKFLSAEFGYNSLVYFLIEDDEYFLLKANIKSIRNVIYDCRYFEYYIIDEAICKIFGENDHNDLMFISI